MIGIHLLREEASEPRINGYLLIDEGNSLITGDLNGRLATLTAAEPGFRPASVTLGIKIDSGHALDIIALYIDLKTGQRVG